MTAAPIAGDLGRLGAPMPRGAGIDDVRLAALLDAVIAAKTNGRLDHATWYEAFASAMSTLRDKVLASARASLESAAAVSRYPARRLEVLFPDAASSEALLNRLLAEGVPLERLESANIDAATQRARAAALEAAWEGASRLATADVRRWRALAADVAEWRRPMPSFWVVTAVTLVLAIVLAGWLGGEIPAPAGGFGRSMMPGGACHGRDRRGTGRGGGTASARTA